MQNWVTKGSCIHENRELDLDVFRCLSFENLSRSLINTEMYTQHSEELRLSLPQLLFLLSDLLGKLACFSRFPSHGRTKSSVSDDYGPWFVGHAPSCPLSVLAVVERAS